MAKFIMSIGDETFRLLGVEAKNRDVTVQQLLRAVIVPEWVKENMDGQTELHPETVPGTMFGSPRRDDGVLLSPVNRLRH